MSDSNPGKPQLRTELRRRRAELELEFRQAAEQQISLFAQSLPQWAAAQHIALYCDIGNEAATGKLATTCRAQGKNLYLPVLQDNGQLQFALWTDAEELLPNSLGIGEPPATASRHTTSELDIIFLPLVGWDRSGGRLGMGGGYYDRTLADVTGPLLIGLAYSIQELDRIPGDSWDIALDGVLTETGIHMFPRGAQRRPKQTTSG